MSMLRRLAPTLVPPRAGLGLRAGTRLFSERTYLTTSGKESDPLRILFCGSDDFSRASLEALYREQQRNPELIRSIDVVVRPAKRVGRGRKLLREAPLKELADSVKLRVHERDTFTGWDMPRPDGEPINLIVAVSFGLFVPRRLLRAAKYGGLNVHPSLLPDLRGPAPLHHAILQRRSHTGLTLQTLSDVSFDAGAVLSQTARPGFPIPPDAKVTDLIAQLAPPAGGILVGGLRAGVHVPPLEPVGWRPTAEEQTRLVHARKLTAADRQVRWTGRDAWGAEGTAVRSRALWPLWTRAIDREGTERRMNLEGDFEVVPRAAWPEDLAEFMRVVRRKVQESVEEESAGPQKEEKGDTAEISAAGEGLELKTISWVQEEELPWKEEQGEKAVTKYEVKMPYFVDGQSIIVPTVKGDCLRIHTIKVDGEKSRSAAAAIRAFSEEHSSDSGFVTALVDSLTLGLANPVTWLEELLP